VGAFPEVIEAFAVFAVDARGHHGGGFDGRVVIHEERQKALEAATAFAEGLEAQFDAADRFGGDVVAPSLFEHFAGAEETEQDEHDLHFIDGEFAGCEGDGGEDDDDDSDQEPAKLGHGLGGTGLKEAGGPEGGFLEHFAEPFLAWR
jgi:hypothetical protein